MYKQLLYSAGGGIISNKQKADQAECATLAIGLGGTGIDCLRRLKRQVYESLQPDDPRDPVPSYSHIKFLAVDSDRSSMRDDGKINPLDEVMEFFDISSPNTPHLPDLFRLIAERPQYHWLNGEIPYSASPDQKYLMTHGIRQIGRLLLMMKSDAFYNKIRLLVTEAMRGFQEKASVNVHIFSGLGGGTGSGTFLDVCYIVQRALDDIGVSSHSRIICGYFFLPDVNLSLPHIGASQDISSYIKANGYAAMKELDYCMNFETYGGKWDQLYRGFRIGPTQDPPVYACHLISTEMMNGIRTVNSYEHAMNTVCDLVMQFLIWNELNIGWYAFKSIEMEGLLEKNHGANYRYIVPGISEAAVPVREISTYLGSKLFDAFSVSRSKYPTDEEVEQIARENLLDFAGLTRFVMHMGTFDMSVPPFEERMWRGVFTESDPGLPNKLLLPGVFLEPFRTRNLRMLDQARMNISALLDERRWDKAREDDSSNSVVRKVFPALEEAAADPGRGPFYAAAVLNGTKGKNLVNILKESLERTQREIEVLRGELLTRQEDVMTACSAYLHPRFLQSRKSLFDTLIEKTDKYYELNLKIAVLVMMRDMIPRMIAQVWELFRRYFAPYCKVYSELLDTFRQNCWVISGGAMELNDSSTIHIPELNAKTIELLDQAVGNLDFDMEASRFNRAFFSAEDAWLTGDEKRITKFVSDYMSGVFDEYTSKTIDEYLEMQFGTTDKRMLQNMISGDILRQLHDRATPLLRKNPAYNPIRGFYDFMIIPYAYGSEAIHSAATKIVDEDPIQRTVNSRSLHRIYHLRCLFGVPMYGYCGTQLYKEVYQRAAGIKGIHIYEGTAKDSRDWRELPDLVPFSMAYKPTEEMLKNKEMYRRAVDAGIIRMSDSGSGGWKLYELVDYEEMEELREIERLAEEAIESHNAAAAEKVLRRTEEYLRSREPARIIPLPDDGANGFKEIVRLDFVLGNPELIKVIRRQFDILDKIQQIESSVEPLYKEKSLMENYCNALFTGVIEYSRGKVTCTMKRFGLTKEIILSDPYEKTQPLGRIAPLYQGFVSYKELRESEQEYFLGEAAERLQDPFEFIEQIRCAFDSLAELLRDNYMKEMQERVHRFPDKAQEIMKFYDYLRREYSNFRLIYGLPGE